MRKRYWFVLMLIAVVVVLMWGTRHGVFSRAVAADGGTAGSFVLPEVAAWKEITWSNDDPNPLVSINLIDKNRWRIEAKNPAKPRILVAAFDGAQLSASNPKSTVALNPRPVMDKIFSALSHGHLVGIEQRDGHNCWHINSRGIVVTADVWVDTQTRFPVYLDGTLLGNRVRGRYTLLSFDPKNGGTRYFAAGSTEPIFSASLVP